jgi:formylglycine-generating enzyme required for sulfatase activity
MGNEEYGPTFVPLHVRSVEPFYLDKTEVTVARYREVRKGLPERLAGLSPGDDEAVRFVTFDEAVRCAEEMGKRLPDEAEYEFAATNAGKNRFPWGDDFDRIKSWTYGPVGIPAYDRALANREVCGLYSNVAEWTSSWHAPYPGTEWSPYFAAHFREQRVVRGGPFSVVRGDADPRGRDANELWDARTRQGIDRDKAHAGLGFRCARSFKPRFPQKLPSP